MQARWDRELVKEHLADAAYTLRRTRTSGERFLSSMRTIWPDIPPDFWEQYGRHKATFTPTRPDAKQLDRLDRTLAWLTALAPARVQQLDDRPRAPMSTSSSMLPADASKIVWGRACNMSWKAIMKLRGRGAGGSSRESLRTIYNRALDLLVKHNTREKIPPDPEIVRLALDRLQRSAAYGDEE